MMVSSRQIAGGIEVGTILGAIGMAVVAVDRSLVLACAGLTLKQVTA